MPCNLLLWSMDWLCKRLKPSFILGAWSVTILTTFEGPIFSICFANSFLINCPEFSSLPVSIESKWNGIGKWTTKFMSLLLFTSDQPSILIHFIIYTVPNPLQKTTWGDINSIRFWYRFINHIPDAVIFIFYMFWEGFAGWGFIWKSQFM